MFFVIFRGESTDIYIPVFWVVLECINFSLMVACYNEMSLKLWRSLCLSSMQIGRDNFIFGYKG